MDLFIIFIIIGVLALVIGLYTNKLYREFVSSKQKVITSSKAKSLFIQKLAYELRNPLNGIIGFSEMLESGDSGELSDVQKERVHNIYQCGIQLQGLVKDLLDLSKGESGEIDLIEGNVSLVSAIDKAIEELAPRIRATKINILMDNIPDISIKADQIKLIQGLKNVIDNSIKFSQNTAKVTISAQRIKGKGLKIAIADFGKGMSKDEAKTIFLFPDDSGKSRSLNGLGIGMPLARFFIELHQGSIKVDSQENVGTTVTIFLPEHRIL